MLGKWEKMVGDNIANNVQCFALLVGCNANCCSSLYLPSLGRRLFLLKGTKGRRL
uniref:Uncharacterized protein n=1 Tax=Arundo donax TaxID=35708 RepID=A0A0A9HS71_ARUDO